VGGQLEIPVLEVHRSGPAARGTDSPLRRNVAASPGLWGACGRTLRERCGSYLQPCTESGRPEGEPDDHRVSRPGGRAVPGAGRRLARRGDRAGGSGVWRSAWAGEPAMVIATQIGGFAGAVRPERPAYRRFPIWSGSPGISVTCR